AAAAWCSTPIAVNGSGFVLTPQVLGPAEVPVVTNPELARHQPQLAVLSAAAHGERSGRQGVFEALLAALGPRPVRLAPTDQTLGAEISNRGTERSILT